MENTSDIQSDSKSRPVSPYISKSKFLSGLQCHKLLWHVYNAKHLIPEADAHQQAIFDQGHEVGELAKQLFPGGIEVGKGVTDLDETLALSKQALSQRRPIYEAAFVFNGGYACADILHPVDRDEWDLIEVKSTADVKNVHLHDLAFQMYVYNGAGLKTRRCFVCHINREFIRQGAINPKEFFEQQDVTDLVTKLAGTIERKLEEMFRVIRLREHPTIQIGPHCDNPYRCPLHDHCWSFLPENSVFNLYRGGKKAFKLLGDGITSLRDVSDDVPLSGNQTIQRQAAITGKPHVDKPVLSAFLKRIRYPVFYLDFETFNTAIPLFDGVRPYQQVPFQFSLHVVRSENSEPEHHSFLAEGTGDPRREFLDRLRPLIGKTGSIVVYNAAFEKMILKQCCAAYPEHQTWVESLKKRFVDLLLPFKRFCYYHPNQHGSASMKAVLPALTGQGYENLAIQDGTTASQEFLRVTFTDVSAQEQELVRLELKEYCALDTIGMVWIIEALKRLKG